MLKIPAFYVVWNSFWSRKVAGWMKRNYDISASVFSWFNYSTRFQSAIGASWLGAVGKSHPAVTNTQKLKTEPRDEAKQPNRW